MLLVAVSILLLGFLTLYDAKGKKRELDDPYEPKRLRLPFRSYQLLSRAAAQDAPPEP